MGSPGISIADTLDAVGQGGRDCEPVTAAEVAEALDCSRRAASDRLRDLADRGALRSKEVGPETRVWWRPAESASVEQSQFRSLVDAVEDYAIFRLDPDGNVVTWNKGARRIKGYEAEDILGHHFSTFYTEADAEAGIPERNLEVARESGRCEDEGWRVRKDGSRFWANVIITPVRGDDGALEGFAKVTRDMTERREREQKVRHERDVTKQIFETTPIGLGVLAADGTITRANARAEELLGMEYDESAGQYEAVNREVYDADGDPIGPAERPSARVFETGEPVQNEEVQFEEPNGERRWLSLSVAPLTVVDGEVERVIAAGEDVTQLKKRTHQLEHAQRALKGELNEVFERIDDAFFALDDEWRFTYVNDRAEELLLTDVDELFGERFWDAYPRVAGTRFEDEYREAMATQEPAEFEARYPGVDKWFEVHAYPSESGLSVYFRDVTDRKERERELERYERIFETIHDGVYAKDGEKFTLVNRAYAEMVGYDREELVGMDTSRIVDEQVVSRAERLYGELLAGDRETAVYEAEMKTKDGDRVPAEATFAALSTDDGHEQIGVVRDVTERKARERALEESERRYRALAENFPNGGVAMFDHDLRYTVAGGRVFPKLGVSADEIEGSTIHERYDPEVAEQIAPYYRAALDGEESSFELEADNGIFQAHTLPVRDEDGEVFSGMVLIQDVTDQRQYEETLRTLHTSARNLLHTETMSDVSQVLVDVAHGVLDLSGTAVYRYDAERDELFPDVATADAEFVSGGLPAVPPGDGSIVGRVYATGETLTFDDVRESPHVHTEDTDMRGGLFVPLDEYGVLVVGSTTVGAFDEQTRQLLELVAANAEAAFDRVDREQTLRERERELESRVAQLDAVASLGQSALETEDIDSLFDEAVRTVVDVLGNDYCKVLELLPGDDELLLREGVGWRDGIVGEATVDTGENSQAGYTLRSESPVVVEDLETESRFSGPELLTSHDVTSGISTIIGPFDEPWGILGTHDTAHAGFTGHDVNFVQSVATILATAIEREERKESLQDAVGKLARSNKRLERFAYITSHDLQEPLRMVSSYLQLLERRYADDLDEDATEFIEFAVDGADRMREMIDDLLAYSRIDTQGEEFESTDVEDVLERTRQNLQVAIEENDATLAAGDLPTVTADASQLLQLFQNLVSNAIKYRGDEPPRIRVDAERRGDEWLFSVADNGIGIDADHEEAVFEIFRRLHANDDRSGTGIGLALCRRIVERHGGRIWVDSEPDDGSTFYFTLPRRDAE